MIAIKSTSNITRFSTPINEGGKRKYTLMKEDYITLKFSVDNPVYFKLGDYVDESFGLFELVDLCKPTINESTGGYDYDLRLDAYYWKWKNKKLFYSPEVGGSEVSWNLTATLDVQLGVFLRNLVTLGYTYKGNAFEISIDSTVENSSKLVRYDNTNLIDALTKLAETWSCEWWLTNSIIHFGRCEYGDPVDFKLGVNVDTMSRSESETSYATRIYAFGSTRNLPTNYRPVDESVVVNGVVQKRLMLPVGTPCVNAYENMTQEEAVVDVVIFDDVYPHRVGTISSVSTHEYTDKIEEEGKETVHKKWNAYRFKDTGLTFSKKYVLPGQELRIKFESGTLNGMDFAVTFNPYDEEGGEAAQPEKKEDGTWNPLAQVFEIVRNEDYGRPLPAETLIPKNGAKYALYGFDTKFVSDAMIPSAEKELLEKAHKYVEKSKIDPSTYDCKMMSTYAYNDGELRIFEIGDRINLINEAYFENGRQSRIIGYEYPLDIPYDSPTYTVGETASYSRIGALEDKIEALTYKGQTYTGSGGSGVYLITFNDGTPATDRNAYSAKRTQKEFLSKLHPDRALESISFAQPSTFESGFHSQGVSLFEEGATVRQPLVVSTEIRSETFAENATGFRGGADGHFEMQSLKVNEFLQTQELRKNRITVNGNEFWFTDSMLVGAVTQLADSDHYLVDARKLTDNYQISFRSSDILKGIYSYETGFKTCFLKVITVNDSLESMHVVSLNHQAPMPNMVLARKSNEVDPDRQASIYADGLNGQLKVLDGYDPDNLSAERVIALLGKLDHFSHPAFPQGFERSGLFAQNVYLIGKFIQRSWDDQYQPNPFWKGLFKEGIQYGEYDLVRWFKPMYGESTYLCKKKPPVGTLPSDGRYWELYIPAGMPAYTYTVFSTKGKSFVAQTLFEEKELTTLFLKVMMGQWDLTAEVPDSAVFWTRESEDPLSDQAWNAANLKYGKQIPIRNTDLNAPSVRFYANIDDSFLNN